MSGRNDESDDVMHDLAIAGPRLGHLHVLVFFEVGRRIEVLILVGAAGFDGVLFGHLDNHIRFADAPTFDELRRGGQVFRIAFLRSAIDPGGDRIDLSLRQTRIIGPSADVRVGVPGRHLPADDFFFDRLRPRPDVFVAEHREGRGFAGSMAFGAALIEDGRDFFVKGDVLGCWAARPA